MVTPTSRYTQDDANALLIIINKAVKEVSKYTMKYSSLEKVINNGEERVREYVQGIQGIALHGASGVFRSGIMRDTNQAVATLHKELRKAQEKKGASSWENGVCPNCGSNSLEYCPICYVRLVAEIQRINRKE